MGEQQDFNAVDLPRWRIDNVYVFVWSSIISIVMATAFAVGIYYGFVIRINDVASDIKDVKKDVQYISQWTGKHEHDTEERGKDYSALKQIVTMLQTKVDYLMKN